MTAKQITFEPQAAAADQMTHSNESERYPPIREQRKSPDVPVITPAPARVSRSSKLVGFERGRMNLQPFVGPKQF